MANVIDFHTHIFPDKIGNWIGDANTQGKLQILKKRARQWFSPFARMVHEAQTGLRHLPGGARKTADSLGVLTGFPNLLLESTAEDLISSMNDAQVDRAVIIASPPHIPNELILEMSQVHSRLIPAVNVPPGTRKPGERLKHWIDQGAALLKIHPAMDGEGVESTRYNAILKVAAEYGLPVILHTGCIHSTLLYKNPELGRAEQFESWFKTYSSVRFVLAHMNYHEPQVAMDLCETYDNLFVDTSWQPAEVIGEAARRLGAERILFGTDWPIVGDNLRVGKDRIEECVQAGTLSDSDAKKILGTNAMRLLNIPDILTEA